MSNTSNTTTAIQAVLIKGGGDYFQLLEKLTAEAEHTIHFQFYIFDADETGQAVANALIAAAKRGVKVYMLLDAYGSQALPKAFVNQLKESGIYFQWFQPMFKSRKFYLGRRLHHKVVVIDSYHSLVSGLNISNRYNDTAEAPAWLDWALHCEGDVSVQLEDICRKRMRLRIPSGKAKGKHSVGNCTVGVRVNDWVARKAQITKSYLSMLQRAQERVIIMSPYFLPGRQFRKRLKLATKRGVKVQVILTADSDVPVAKYAERWMYRWLLKYNIEIYEYQKNVLHGKMATADGNWATVGSYNVNNLSAYVSVELNLEVTDEAVVHDVDHRLEEIIRNDCKRITQQDFDKQSTLINRLMQGAAYNLLRFTLFVFTFRIRHPE